MGARAAAVVTRGAKRRAAEGFAPEGGGGGAAAGSLGIHNEVGLRRARSCWSVRHHWVEFDWREKVLVGLVLVLFACQAVLALLLLILIPRAGVREAARLDGVVGRKTALLGLLLVIVAYFQLQAAMHGILDDNVAEMVALPTINFCAFLITSSPSPRKRPTTRASPASAPSWARQWRGRTGRYVFCRATGVDPARCAQTFAESWTVAANGTESGDERRCDAAGGLYVSLYLVVILAALISSIHLTAAAVQCRRHFGWRSYNLVAPGGYERPRVMYEALNATLTSVRGSFLLVVLQLLGYAAFHAHVLCAPLQVLFWVAFLLHIALLLILYFELGLAARGMKTRGALLFYATRLYAKLRRKLQPQKQRRQGALLVLAGIAVAGDLHLPRSGDGSCALTYVCMGPTAPRAADALPGAAHGFVAIDVAALLLKLLMPLSCSASTATAPPSPTFSTTTRWRAARRPRRRRRTPRHNRRQPTLPDELKLLRQRARPIGSPIWKGASSASQRAPTPRWPTRRAGGRRASCASTTSGSCGGAGTSTTCY